MEGCEWTNECCCCTAHCRVRNLSRRECDFSRLNDALLQLAAEGRKNEKRGLSVEDWVVVLHM